MFAERVAQCLDVYVGDMEFTIASVKPLPKAVTYKQKVAPYTGAYYHN